MKNKNNKYNKYNKKAGNNPIPITYTSPFVEFNESPYSNILEKPNNYRIHPDGKANVEYGSLNFVAANAIGAVGTNMINKYQTKKINNGVSSSQSAAQAFDYSKGGKTNKYLYKGRKYTVHFGPKKGKYIILKNNTKKYI